MNFEYRDVVDGFTREELEFDEAELADLLAATGCREEDLLYIEAVYREGSEEEVVLRYKGLRRALPYALNDHLAPIVRNALVERRKVLMRFRAEDWRDEGGTATSRASVSCVSRRTSTFCRPQTSCVAWNGSE